MNNKELYYKRLIRAYDLKRSEAHRKLQERTAEVYAKVPEIQKIDQQLNQSGIQLVRSMLTQKDGTSITDFQKHTEELQRTKKMLLVEAGYSPTYLETTYDCKICKDTGFVGNKPCSCFKQGLVDIAYEQSNLKNILAIENFNTFSMDYYSKEIPEGSKFSPYKIMERIYQLCVGFIENFSSEKPSLLFYGNTGLGKTFLCNCIAKELLDNGYTVIYLTAPQLFKLFEESKFHREDMEDEEKDLLSTLTTADLLIIDDLGTESATSVTIGEFFDVLNSRYINQSSTIISTNLAPNEWNKFYSDRIVSRIFGNYINMRFIGSDIRLQKKYHKSNK